MNYRIPHKMSYKFTPLFLFFYGRKTELQNKVYIITIFKFDNKI